MDNILNTLLTDTYTQTALKHKLAVLKTYLLQSFYGSEQKAELMEKDVIWLRSLPPVFFQNFNKDNTSDLILNLEKSITQLKTLIVYLAFEADDSSLSYIGRYARKTFSSIGRSTSGRNLPLLLDVKYDPKLIAGAAFVWNGVYKDYSVHAKIDEKKSLILDIFKKYLR